MLFWHIPAHAGKWYVWITATQILFNEQFLDGFEALKDEFKTYQSISKNIAFEKRCQIFRKADIRPFFIC